MSRTQLSSFVARHRSHPQLGSLVFWPNGILNSPSFQRSDIVGALSAASLDLFGALFTLHPLLMVGTSTVSSEMERTAYEPLISNGMGDRNKHYDHVRDDSCVNARQAAIISATYTTLSSLATFFGYCYLLATTSLNEEHLADVYWGVQASYVGILIAEATSLSLSLVLTAAICQENSSLIVPWVLGFIGSMSLEALAIVYSNVLRDHVNQGFDRQCRVEVGFFVSKTIINLFAIGAVVRLYRQLKSGVSWKPTDIYEL